MRSDVSAVVLYLLLIAAIFYGWINNIVILFHSSFATITGELVLRTVGIFVAPLGVVMGYL
jgi:hypothetical protein